MDAVHPFEPANPRRLFDLEDSVRRKAAGSERMARKGFVVRRPEHVRRWTVEGDEHDRFVGLVVNGADIRAVPVRVALLGEVREE